MVLGLLLREDEERALKFDFEMMLPDEAIDRDDGAGGHGGRKDFKRGTVVCRHWLRALCMKGDNCEFLHQYDMSKMPECRWGMECQVPECPFRHVPDEERVECAFYRQGFCSHGSSCRYRHIKLARDECPEVADFTLQAKVADEENVKRRKAQPVNEFFKIAICKHWEKIGNCPFGDECHFAHGDKELRPFPKGERDSKELAAVMARNGADRDRDRDHHHGSRGGGRGPPSSGFGDRDRDRGAKTQQSPAAPVLPDANKLCKYFLAPSQSYHNVAHSVHFGKWSLPQAAAQQLKLASETSDDVFLIVTVGPSKHFQGVVRLAPGAMLHAGTETGEDLAAGIVPFERDGKTQWSGAFSVEWLRICECPWERLQQFENKTLAVPDCANGLELDADMGHALVRLLFNQAPIKLHYKSVEDEQKLPGGAEALAVRRREAAESLLRGPGFDPPPPLHMQVPPPQRWKPSRAGFVVTCTTATIDECFGRLLFGLAKDQEVVAMQHVAPGTPLFLLNTSDMHVLGVFEAVSPAVVNMVPGAFSTAGPQAPSPLPVHVRFAVMLNAPAIPSTDPALQLAVGDRGVQPGPLSLAVTQKLTDVFAERCGAMFGPPKGMAPPLVAGVGGGAARDGGGAPFVEKLPVGIENDAEFNVTRRVIGHAGANMKRIMAEAGAGTKVCVRGRGSGSKESGVEDMHEPLVVLVTADNERSMRIACDLASELLAGVHRDYRGFLAQRGGGPGPHRSGGPPFRGPPPHGGPGGFSVVMPRGGGSGPGAFVKQDPSQ